MSFSIVHVIDKISTLDDNVKYLIYSYLHEEIKSNEYELLPISQNANDPEYLKSLLTKKKEVALDELALLIPYLQHSNQTARRTILKILPVLLSYVTLYDMRIWKAFQILDVLKIHSAFAEYQHIFIQWFVVFEKRRNSRNRSFSFKDEFFVSNLPPVDEISGDPYCQIVGYSNVALLRAFHRWLRLHRLHKYLYIFANLTYQQILSINEENIDKMQSYVGLSSMTLGAKSKILREIEELRKRKSVLIDGVIKKNFTSLLEIELAIREIKRILRTPIQVTREENLPNLLVQALNKICGVVLDYVGTGEGIIPIYGLLISILKESWNYSIFSPIEKTNFNFWRNTLSEKINNNNNSNTVTNMMSMSDIMLPFQSSTSPLFVSAPCDQLFGEFSLENLHIG